MSIMCIYYILVYTYKYICFCLCLHLGSDRPKLSELCDHVRVGVAPYWYDLGMQLLNEEQSKKLNVIQADHPGDSEKCCTALFDYWLQANTAASWDKLIIALNHIKQDALASTIKKMTMKGTCIHMYLSK